VCATLAILMWARPAWPDQNPTLSVTIANDAEAPGRTLENALAIAGGVFRRAGVDVVWRGDPVDSPTDVLTVRVAANVSDVPFSAADDSMGAVRNLDGVRATVAYVFFDRARDFADRGHVDVWIVLGCVIAHELGHLVLPVNAHAAEGVMVAQWDPHMFARAGGLLSFAPDQAQLLRRRVASRQP
jgi:hypothetical protein